MQDIKETVIVESSKLCGSTSRLQLHYADVICSVMNPSENSKTSNEHREPVSSTTHNEGSGRAAAMSYKIGGLNWTIPEGFKIEDYTLFWIGSDNAAFANVVLTFNGCEIGTDFDFLKLHFQSFWII